MVRKILFLIVAGLIVCLIFSLTEREFVDILGRDFKIYKNSVLRLVRKNNGVVISEGKDYIEFKISSSAFDISLGVGEVLGPTSDFLTVKREKDLLHISGSGKVEPNRQQGLMYIELKGRKLQDLLKEGYTHLILKLDGFVENSPLRSFIGGGLRGQEGVIEDNIDLEHAVLLGYEPYERGIYHPYFYHYIENLENKEVEELKEIVVPLKKLLRISGPRQVVAVDPPLPGIENNPPEKPSLILVFPGKAVQSNIDLYLGDTIRIEKRSE